MDMGWDEGVKDDVGGWECDWDVKGCMCAQIQMGKRKGMR